MEIEAQRLVSRTGAYSEAQDYQVFPSATEWWKNAKGRVSPEGVAVTSSIFLASIPSILPIEASLTTATHLLSSGSPDLARATLIGISGIANVASVALESRALREKEYSASPYGSALIL